MKKLLLLPLFVFLLANEAPPAISIISYIADPQHSRVEIFWKDERGQRIGSLGNLRNKLEARGRKVQCLMNAGMFRKDFSPQGCYIENGKVVVGVDRSEGSGNFYLKPNGILAIASDGAAKICKTEDFEVGKDIAYATQSGPMLVSNGKIHAAFMRDSNNLNIRNGVGVLPDGKLLFAISETKINFYEFASFFQKAGCLNALYLDGFVSKAYIPDRNYVQTDGNFGPMIAVIARH